MLLIEYGEMPEWLKGTDCKIKYFLPEPSENCSPIEESIGDNFSNSVKPLEDGNAEPNS